MRIRFLVTNAFAPSGIVRTTFTLADQLAQRGHRVEVVSMFRNRESPSLRQPGRRRVRIRVLYDRYAMNNEPETLGRRTRLVRKYLTRYEEQPSRLIHPEDVRYGSFSRASDIVLRRYLRSLKDGAVVGTRVGLSLAIADLVPDGVIRVAQEHTTLRRYRPALREAVEARYPSLDLVTALTHPASVEYAEALGGGARVARIPNAVARSKLLSTVERPVIVAAGRITRPKGFDRLIPAFAAASREHPGWRLRIFGRLTHNPKYVNGLQKRISKLGLEDQVSLEGFTPRMQAELADASIFAHGSRFEGFPMVILEAMACQLPVVAFDCPHGPADAIEDGVNGYLIPDGDIDAFGRALSGLMGDADRRRAFSAAALKTAEDYSPELVAASFEELLVDVAAAKGMRL